MKQVLGFLQKKTWSCPGLSEDLIICLGMTDISPSAMFASYAVSRRNDVRAYITSEWLVNPCPAEPRYSLPLQQCSSRSGRVK